MNKRSDVTSSSIAIGYTRASLGINKQKYTIEAQHGEMSRWSAYNVVPVVEIFDDQDSSTSKAPHAREVFERCFAAVKATKADFLLVVDRDRVARNSLQMLMLEAELFELDPPCRIVTTSQDPEAAASEEEEADRVFMNVITDAMAQRERARIRARTKRALATARKQGIVPGPKNWESYTRGKLTIQLVKRLSRSGFSNGAIVRYCESHAILSPHRGKMTLAHVRLCLGSDYPESDISETVASLTAQVLDSKYYLSKFVPGDDTDRMRVHE